MTRGAGGRVGYSVSMQAGICACMCVYVCICYNYDGICVNVNSCPEAAYSLSCCH